MKSTIFIPYVNTSDKDRFDELLLLKSIVLTIKNTDIGVNHLVCDGIYSLCDKDKKNNWRRNISSCLTCNSEQKNLLKNLNLPTHSLSSFVDKEEVFLTKKIIDNFNFDEIKDFNFLNTYNIYQLSQNIFTSIFNKETPDFSNENHKLVYKHFINTVIKTVFCSIKYLKNVHTDIIFCINNTDLITGTFCKVAEQFNKKIILFSKIRSVEENKNFLHISSALENFMINEEEFHSLNIYNQLLEEPNLIYDLNSLQIEQKLKNISNAILTTFNISQNETQAVQNFYSN